MSRSGQPYRPLKRVYDDTLSRCTTLVWLSAEEHGRGRIWAWDTYVMPVLQDKRLVWLQYKKIHIGKSLRVSQETFISAWTSAHDIWNSNSVAVSDIKRVSDDKRVFLRMWPPDEITSKEYRVRFLTARRTVEEMARRARDRYAQLCHQANAVAFKSHSAHDAFRAMIVRTGRRIVNNGGELVVEDNRKQLPIYYRTSTPTVPNSRQRAVDAPRVNTSGFQWVRKSADDGGFETTDTDTGLQVTCCLFVQEREREATEKERARERERERETVNSPELFDRLKVSYSILFERSRPVSEIWRCAGSSPIFGSLWYIVLLLYSLCVAVSLTSSRTHILFS
jgi:hypothetical protein